jgi:hypothetical protein
MAKITDKGISGLIGSVVLYRMNGKDYIRSKPAKRKRKKGVPVRQENAVFGTVSKYGSRMLKMIADSLPFALKLSTYNSLRGWMCNEYTAYINEPSWELAVKRTSNCQLNPESDLRDFLGIDFTITDTGNGKISIGIPAINPAEVKIRFMAVSSVFGLAPITENIVVDQYEINYNNSTVPANTMLLNTKAATGNIAIVVIALEFETAASGSGLYETDKRWLPTAVVAMGRMK